MPVIGRIRTRFHKIPFFALLLLRKIPRLFTPAFHSSFGCSITHMRGNSTPAKQNFATKKTSPSRISKRPFKHENDVMHYCPVLVAASAAPLIKLNHLLCFPLPCGLFNDRSHTGRFTFDISVSIGNGILKTTSEKRGISETKDARFLLTPVSI